MKLAENFHKVSINVSIEDMDKSARKKMSKIQSGSENALINWYNRLINNVPKTIKKLAGGINKSS